MSMKIDIDTLSADISSSLAQESLQKALPPRLAYRLRAWFKRFHPGLGQKNFAQVKQTVTQKFEQALALQELKKNEVQATTFDNAMVRLDFGSDVPESVRKSVMSWAKRRGLKAIEASLTKSQNARSSVTYAADEKSSTPGLITNMVKWEIR